MLVMNAAQLFVLLYVAKLFIFDESIYHSYDLCCGFLLDLDL